ncbi:MAG: hypothetical protein A2Z16_08815 [Chloroflexi bacterium RBG_16_54_18]|nr:MAG: hypothetical protein A2Z16_08815 [Chloroflexi bacterium RBG_16_54_18]
MTDENTTPNNETFGTRLITGFFSLTRIVVRFLLIVLLLGFLALLLFGVPYVYWRFVTPTVNEFQHLASAQVAQEQLNQRLLDNLDNMQQRADTLETRLDSEKQQFGVIEESIGALVATQKSQIELFHETQNGADESLQSITGEITALETKLEGLNTSMEQFGSSIGAVEEKSKELEARLFSDDEPINQLRRDIQLLKAMELLTRSRLFMSQNNLGLAEGDILYARGLLLNIQVPDAQAEVLADTIERIDQAIDNLPLSPDMASQNLEIAWQLLNLELFSHPAEETSTVLSSTPASVEETATPQSSETITPSPTP